MADHTAPSFPATHPLVGREREQATLRDTLAAALAGRGSLVLIGGEAGLGKTVLAEALLAEAENGGALVLVGGCYDLAETPPYGPWAGVLDRTSTGAEPPDLTGGVGLTSQAALLAAVRDYLVTIAARQLVVLLLEDLHWADPASLDLLRFLARGLAALPLLLLATYRSDELTRRHPLYQLLPILVREAHATRLDLRPFGENDLRALVARYTFPAEDEASLVTYLIGRAEGNPFYAGELLRDLEETGMMHQADARWVLGDPGAMGVPPLLRQVIDARVDRLGEETRALLGMAAVIGQEVPLAVWAAAAETAEEALLAPVERAIEARLLAEMPDDTGVRFAHALIREVLYTGLPRIRRRFIHRRVGEALVSLPRPDPDAVAYHLRQADDERAAEWLVRAGDRAQRAYALISAAERFEAALALLERRDTAGRERGWLLLRLARVRRLATPADAIRSLDEAIAIAASLQDRTLAAYALTNRGLLRCYFEVGSDVVDELVAGVAALDALAPADRARLRELQEFIGDPVDPHPYRSTLALMFAGLGRFAEARALAERAIADTPDEPAAGGVGASFVADAYLALAQAQAALGQPSAAHWAFARAYGLYQAVGHHVMAGLCLVRQISMAATSYHADDLAERRRLVAQWEGEDARSRDAQAAAPQRLGCLPVLVLEGQWEEARVLAQAARPSGSYVAVRALVLLAYAQGDQDLAQELIQDWLPNGPETTPAEGHFSLFFLFPSLCLQRIAAALALDAGDLPLAGAWLRANDRWLAWCGAVLERAEGALSWAAYHRAAGEPSAAREHAERALTQATEPRQPLGLLAAHRLLGELATHSGQYAEATDHLVQALALADACAAPHERALTLLALAELHLAIGDRPQATTTLAEARTLLAPLEARPALARADALATPAPVAPAPPAIPFGLTAREAEVLRLVAAGLPDAEIAARLFLSRRTVHAHLRTIYGKTGVASRSAATRFAIEHHLA